MKIKYAMYAAFPPDYYARQMGSKSLRQRWFSKRQHLTAALVKKYHSGGRLLDIGCGNCLWNSGDVSTIGIDICEPMLRHNCRSNASFIPLVADISQNLPLKNESIETVVITEVLEHLPSYASHIEEIWRVLKKGGVVIASVPYAKFPGLWGVIFPLWCKFKGLKEKDEYYLRNCGHVVNFNMKMLQEAFSKFSLLEKIRLDLMTIVFVGKKD